ncbi:MAG: RNA polymerase sigma-70 factor [Sphingobacterium sp.]|jgi:RNA polymerase sigma-70 factor (ECF subfamily)|nr:RNA polymerase sigma-70 factor [Sphingobacterium sp.]
MNFEDQVEFNKHYKVLCYFAWEMVRDTEMAEDLVQDAFIAYLNNKHKISQEPMSIRSFLYSSIRNAIYNQSRKNKTVQKYLDRQSADEMDDTDYEHKIIRAEFMAEIARVVDGLPDSCQHIFKLSYLDGFSNQEIAEQLAISVNTIKTQKQRALQVLRKKIHPEFFFVVLLLVLINN